tara:strand:+ start:47 stop:682 length:636 start_codon:yes stop_codon:yes gene_type:complete
MGTPYIGGWRFSTIEWSGLNTIRVEFSATGWANRYFQAYVGRKLVNVTRTPAQRSIEIELPIDGVSPIALIVVEADDRATDYGHLLCWRPWNSYCVKWLAPAATGDLSHFDVLVSETAGGPYTSTVIGRVDYDATLTDYTFDLPDFAESGDWEITIVPRDDASPSGNAGTVSTLTLAVVVYPKDLALDPNGDRFTFDVVSGTLTADFAYGV